MRFGVLIIAAWSPLLGQSEQALKAFFEGKQVRVKIDMPATHEGIDVTPGAQPAIDFRRYSQRVKNAGTSLHSGDTAMVTLVRVKSRNIEFQLGGGGYGTSGDESASVYLPSVSKSRRESDIEKQLKTETDARQRDSLSRELSRLRDQRRRDETYRQAEQTRLTEMKKMEIREKALRGGSRFNIWFAEGRLKESVPAPPELMAMLADYVELADAQPAAPPSATEAAHGPRTAPTAATVATIRRGMTLDQIHALVGQPEAVRDTQEGRMTVHEERYSTENETVEVEFVNNVVVRYRIVSR